MTATNAGAAGVTCVLLGGGGHALMLLESLKLNAQVSVAGLLVPGGFSSGQTQLGVDILGGDDVLPDLSRRGITHFVVAVGGVGNNQPRRQLYELALTAGLVPLTVVHPASIVSPQALLGAGCQLMPGAIVNAGATLGANVIVNSGAIVEHECVVGDHAHVATGARLASTVTVGTGAHIGAGATVIQCLRVGDWAVVGAGAVVVRDIGPGATVVGVPARPIPQPGAKAPNSAKPRG